MIHINFFYNSPGKLLAFEIKGHGPDYICSAISILSINTINCIEKLTNDKFFCDYNKNGGLINFKFASNNISHDAQILIMALEFGLKDVCDKYKKYVHITEVKL